MISLVTKYFFMDNIHLGYTNYREGLITTLSVENSMNILGGLSLNLIFFEDNPKARSKGHRLDLKKA